MTNDTPIVDKGTTKVIQVVVKHARTRRDAKKMAMVVGTSTLFKTAMFGQDPNWGRIMAAIGRSSIAIKPDRISLAFDTVTVVKKGVGVGIASERAAKKGLREKNHPHHQSLCLAEPVAEYLGVPLLIDSLVRTRQTPPQTTLEWKDRRTNVRNAFSVRRPEEVEKKALLLVDDVLTTGSTVNECARTLRNAGAKSIHVLALARTV